MAKKAAAARKKPKIQTVEGTELTPEQKEAQDWIKGEQTSPVAEAIETQEENKTMAKTATKKKSSKTATNKNEVKTKGKAPNKETQKMRAALDKNEKLTIEELVKTCGVSPQTARGELIKRGLLKVNKRKPKAKATAATATAKKTPSSNGQASTNGSWIHGALAIGIDAAIARLNRVKAALED